MPPTSAIPITERKGETGEFDPADREYVTRVLGPLRYKPLAVMDRCPEGHPRVILAFHGTEVSTTLFWLTCRELREAVARVEAAGGIERIERALAADASLAAAFGRAQRLYRRLLYRVFCRELPHVDPGPFLRRVRGVAGVSDPRFVKCLHAQVAFTLVTGRGPAGTMVLTELGFRRGPTGAWEAGGRPAPSAGTRG